MSKKTFDLGFNIFKHRMKRKNKISSRSTTYIKEKFFNKQYAL